MPGAPHRIATQAKAPALTGDLVHAQPHLVGDRRVVETGAVQFDQPVSTLLRPVSHYSAIPVPILRIAAKAKTLPFVRNREPVQIQRRHHIAPRYEQDSYTGCYARGELERARAGCSNCEHFIVRRDEARNCPCTGVLAGSALHGFSPNTATMADAAKKLASPNENSVTWPRSKRRTKFR